MISSSLSSYWRAARAPRYSLVFAFPLLISYELLALALSHGEVTGVRNGADVLLKSLFVALGGRYGLALFGVVVIGGGAAIAWRDLRRSGGIRSRYLLWMLGESVAYALVFGMVAGTLTFMLLPHLSMLGGASGVGFAQEIQSLPTQLMISLGAGIYEELLFRVVLVSGLAWLGCSVFGWTKTAANAFAIVGGALIFSAFHYIGPYGEPLRLDSFTFRAIAGLLFSGLYVLRGFGITAWTHALYDVFLAVG
jgi:hypothetical protein